MRKLRRGTLLLLACLLCAGPAAAAKKAWRIVFVGPLSGPLAERTKTYVEGLEAGAAAWSGSDPLEGRALEIVAVDDGGDPDAYKKVAAAVKKAKPLAIAAAPSGRCVAAVAAIARKRKVPLLLLNGWEPRYSLDKKDPIVHLSAGHVDHAIWAANYAMLPFGATKAAALHDDSDPARDLAAAFQRNLGARTAAGGAHAIPAEDAACAALLARLGEAGVDVAFVGAELPAALRVARAAAQAKDAPKLLFQDGLAVPTLLAAAPETARWLEGTLPLAEREIVGRFRRTRKGPPSPNAERGYAAVHLFVRGLRRNALKEKGLVDAVRRVPDPKWRHTPVCTEWGQAKLFECFLIRVKEGTAERLKPLYEWSHTGGTLLRYGNPKKFTPDPDGTVVKLTWGKPDLATIDKDLKRLGLHTGGYEGPMDQWVKDELLARCLAYVSKMYWRNADGTPIPGVSFDISFGLDVPEGTKSHKIWIVTIAGDDSEAGGRAFPPNKAFTFSTFLERTMFRQHAMKPPLATKDVKFWIGRYKWGSSAEENIRHDTIRSLINGYAGAMALTTAHECGHLGGLGHDEVTNRSIMNVVDAKGLDPESGEWIPDHVKQLERSLGREPEPKRRR